MKAEPAQGKAIRAEAARTEETQTAIKKSKHAQDTIYNADRLANLKTGIDVDARAELARAERLHRDINSRSPTYGAQADAGADATARSALADKASALDRQLPEGLGVVASLGGDLRRATR